MGRLTKDLMKLIYIYLSLLPAIHSRQFRRPPKFRPHRQQVPYFPQTPPSGCDPWTVVYEGDSPSTFNGGDNGDYNENSINYDPTPTFIPDPQIQIDTKLAHLNWLEKVGKRPCGHGPNFYETESAMLASQIYNAKYRNIWTPRRKRGDSFRNKFLNSLNSVAFSLKVNYQHHYPHPKRRRPHSKSPVKIHKFKQV